MRARSLAPLLLVLCGCGWSPERFAKKVSYEWCDWRHRCDAIDAGQAEICWQTEQDTWLEHLGADDCSYAKAQSKKLYRMYVAGLEGTDCSLAEAYSIIAELAEDICGQPHSGWDTQEDPEDTGDSGA